MSKLTRRFLVGSGTAVVLLGGGSLLACRSQSRARTAHLDRLDILLSDMVAPERIGRAFRCSMGLDWLEGAAARNPHIAHAVTHDCAVTRRDMLRAGVRQDFATGKVVLCEHFVLAETECVIAGLRYDQAEQGSGVRI